MIASLKVTIGVEVDIDEAREIARKASGESVDDLTNEEVLEVWAESELSHGLGCDVEILGID